jgi:myosin heavy subunit
VILLPFYGQYILFCIYLSYCFNSSQADVRDFLFTLNLNRDNYQLGTSKIFLRESEKVKLDYRLHQQIMASIVAIQRWTRAVLERRRFLRLREAVILIQVRKFCYCERKNGATYVTLCFVHINKAHNVSAFGRLIFDMFNTEICLN